MKESKLSEQKVAEVNRLAENINAEFDILFTEHSAFIKNGNKQAAKRARVSSNTISKLLKEYRSASITAVA